MHGMIIHRGPRCHMLSLFRVEFCIEGISVVGAKVEVAMNFELVGILPELIGSLKLVNVLDFVQLIFCLGWPINQLNKNPSIA